MWTKEQIAHLLRTNDKAVERAIVALYNRQTADEKQASDTKHTNHRGFRSYYARWVNSGRRLTGFHLANARKIAMQYTRQLAEEANSKLIDKQEDERERRKANFIGADVPAPEDRDPPIGTYAYTARMMARMGIMSGDEADRWKDEMKESMV